LGNLLYSSDHRSEARFFQIIPYQLQTSPEIDRLGNIGVHAGVVTPFLVLFESMGGHGNDWDMAATGVLFLPYVWLPNGTMLNEAIVRAGYAQPATFPPNVKYQDLFQEAAREARKQRRGLWE